MAQPTNLYDTYDTTGIREDLVDVIYSISPEDTPILSAIPRTTAKSTKHEWQLDSLATPAANSVIELIPVRPFFTRYSFVLISD